MLLLAWLLGLLCAVGSCWDEEEFYGKTFRMRLHVRAKALDFTRFNGDGPFPLWKADLKSTDRRRKIVGNYFTVYNVTQLDAGLYSMKDKNQLVLSTSRLTVVENSKTYLMKSGERFQVSFNLEPDSCHIDFSADREHRYREYRIVIQGSLDWDRFNQECSGFELLPPCGLVIEDLQTSCQGTFTFKDDDANIALRADLTVESSVDVWKIGVSSTVVAVLVSCCCCCMKRCCCKKSKKDEAGTPDGEAAVHREEYEREPVVLHTYQPNPATLYPVLPSDAPAGSSEPLVHPSPPPMPPAYSEVSVPAHTGDAPSAPTVPFPLDAGPEPRFELKGLTFDSPLNPNSSQSDVYTSDKLNFL